MHTRLLSSSSAWKRSFYTQERGGKRERDSKAGRRRMSISFEKIFTYLSRPRFVVA